MNIIYALQDPNTYEIRYIGKSMRGLYRPNLHLLPCYYNSPRHETYPLYRWIRKLARKSYTPNIIIVQSFENKEHLNEAEKYWISYFKNQYPLLNTTIGGDGSLGYKYTQEQRNNLSKIRKNIPKSESFKKRMSEHWHEEHVVDDKFKQAVSNGTKSWWNNLDSSIQNKIISKNLNYAGKNKRSIIDNEGKIYISLTEAGKQNNCSPAAIRLSILENRSIRSGKTFQYNEVICG